LASVRGLFSPQPPGTDRVQPNKANPFRVFTLLKLLHLFLLSLSLSHLAFASDWKQETNGRWGYVLTYPASLIPEPLPTNGAGRRYHSADNEVSLAAFGSHTNTGELNQSLESFWQKELAERATTVTYKVKRNNWYVISRVNPNGYEFYHKVFFYPTYWVEFEITYPHAQHDHFDAWVARISRDFVPALPDNGTYDR